MKSCPIKAIGVIINWKENQGYGHEQCDEEGCALWAGQQCALRSFAVESIPEQTIEPTVVAEVEDPDDPVDGRDCEACQCTKCATQGCGDGGIGCSEDVRDKCPKPMRKCNDFSPIVAELSPQTDTPTPHFEGSILYQYKKYVKSRGF